jgi:hypothetical protein
LEIFKKIVFRPYNLINNGIRKAIKPNNTQNNVLERCDSILYFTQFIDVEAATCSEIRETKSKLLKKFRKCGSTGRCSSRLPVAGGDLLPRAGVGH